MSKRPYNTVIMCGRLTQITSPKKLGDEFGISEESLPPVRLRYNLAPLQPILALVNEHRVNFEIFLWGLIPSWAKDSAIASRIINARIETVSEKPSFRGPLNHQRCLIPADGFYEWKKTGNQKTPYYIQPRDKAFFTFAGLWSHWIGSDGAEINSCAIMTQESNGLMKTIHSRMPVMIQKKNRQAWLDPSNDNPKNSLSLLSSNSLCAIEAFPVSLRVNDPKQDSPECILPRDSGLLAGNDV